MQDIQIEKVILKYTQEPIKYSFHDTMKEIFLIVVSAFEL